MRKLNVMDTIISLLQYGLLFQMPLSTSRQESYNLYILQIKSIYFPLQLEFQILSSTTNLMGPSESRVWNGVKWREIECGP